ncbi:hypothetical protein BH766_gp83 [Gordonia phage Demosthenes]|uniref:Uncharacterized protein n=1 Tax=Gordonia phage Demosthenes TaxID=1838067 RepID=A0A160DE68_9CAUD|nr:hypothetical protein BH766_gp83 [Gordonia phage Demosthenes]ANA86052.1 hypothetical protein PBI_DEMOSTHENES_83 [Gordonia phage Demosthenes]
MNNDLLVKTYNTIVDHPEDWDQSTWTSMWITDEMQLELNKQTGFDGRAIVDLDELKQHGCKTAMCFAGWALYISGMHKRVVYSGDVDREFVLASDFELTDVTLQALSNDGIADEISLSAVPIGDVLTSSVGEQARMALGMYEMSDSEWDALTSISNTLAELRAMVLSLIVTGSVIDYMQFGDVTTKITDADIEAAHRSYHGV